MSSCGHTGTSTPSTVAPPKPNIGLISVMTAAGKFSDGVALREAGVLPSS